MGNEHNLPSETALIKRINRKLAYRGEKLKTSRGERARIDLGDHHVIDTSRNTIVSHHVNLELFARELGVLA